jgi:hypothetical protein
MNTPMRIGNYNAVIVSKGSRNTDEGYVSASGEAVVGREDKGLVQVTFYPERAPRQVTEQLCIRDPDVPKAAEKTSINNWSGMNAGITGLSGHSDQQFVNVGPIDRDETAIVMISLRLVSATAPSTEPRPLPERNAETSNPVPKPVG